MTQINRWDESGHSYTFSNGKRGFLVLMMLPATVRAEQPILLQSVSQLEMSVTDEATGLPVGEFRIETSRSADAKSGWDNDAGLAGQNGRFETSMTRLLVGTRLRVVADGYLPVISDVITNTKQRLDWSFKLKSAHDFAGTVLLPDGSPAKEASVAMVGSGEQVGLLRFGTFAPDPKSSNTVTVSANGKFRLPSRTNITTLAVAHSAGFAMVSGSALGENMLVRLQPWGRIEGTLSKSLLSTNPTEVTIRIIDQGAPTKIDTAHQYRTRVDADGHFIFTNVPPGECNICRVVYLGTVKQGLRLKEILTYNCLNRLQVTPGNVVHVNINGSPKRTLVPQMPAVSKANGTWRLGGMFLEALSGKESANEPGFKPEGFSIHHFLNSNTGSYVLLPQADGKVDLTEVIPGRYRLTTASTDSPIDGIFNLILGPLRISSIDVDIPENGGEITVSMPATDTKIDPAFVQYGDF